MNDDFFCSRSTSYTKDDIKIAMWDTNILNYSDKVYNKIGIYSGDIIDGICGNVYVNFVSNKTAEFVNGTLSYYSQCNLSDTISWKWNIQSLCNITNNVCVKVKQNDIFYIHKNVFKVYQINEKEIIYEQIAYIQPEIWVIVIVCCFVCCFGINSFGISESGKLVT